ncbi:MAG: M13 family metallopeptidase [Ignavibacteria bacterium]|nr:M13 family metallopeptidase [Ignavibacteria bacterium]
MKLINTLFILLCLFVMADILPAQEHSPRYSNRGITVEDIDLTIDPNVDFYRYSSGNWLKNNPIPPEYSSWSNWTKIAVDNEKALKEILERDPRLSSNSNAQKLADLYYTALDTQKIEADGMNPVKNDLARIDAISTKADVMNVFTDMKKAGTGGLFSMWAGQDDRNSENVILQLYQSGLGMPDRDYYLKDDAKSVELREKYRKFIENMFVNTGQDRISASEISNRVLALETRLAKAMMSRVEMRQAEATYHLMSLDEVKAMMPDFAWDMLFEKLEISDKSNFEKGINVGQPEFFKELNRMFGDTDTDAWKNYLKWVLLRNAGNKLSKPFADEVFAFYSGALSGIEKKMDRWRVSIDFVEDAMGEALGQMFVAEKFKPEAKQRALEMVGYIKDAFRDRLMQNEWMSEETKKKALDKLSAFVVKIGYTDKWRDFSGLEIDRSSLYENMKRASEFNTRYYLSKINKPVDRTEWWMFPQTVNAYYSSSKNEIVFPAGILQPPFYDPDVDDAVNFGGIGMVIGHEMTHGFDDQGRKYDAYGNLTDWWTEVDAERFKERADKLVEQYDGYKVFDDLNVNGELTLGENIADLGGLIIAYYGLQKALEGKDRSPIDGFTPEQRFFLSHSQIWRGNMRPERLRTLVQTDPHSPNEFRVIGPLSNMEEFMNAFGGKQGDPMVRPEGKRVVIW